MSRAYTDSKAVEKWAGEFRGVFSTADLRNLLDGVNEVTFFRRLKALRSLGVIRRFSRCFYITESFDLEALSARINPESCISFGNVLAKDLIIGSAPANTVTAVKCGRTRRYLSDAGNVVHLGIAPHLMFGYTFRNGIRYADNEKALIDTLYYCRKGRRFSFDVYTDVNFALLNRARIDNYLKRYRNPRFVKFVKGVLDAQD